MKNLNKHMKSCFIINNWSYNDNYTVVAENNEDIIIDAHTLNLQNLK